MIKFMARHGDLLIESIDKIPEDTKVRKSGIILDGEVTGHAHRLNGGLVLEKEDRVYLSLKSPGTVTHEEHHTINLPAGDYAITRQREYDPYEKAVRNVAD